MAAADTKVTHESLNKNALLTTYNLLNNRALIKDPRNSGQNVKNRVFVYKEDPNILAADFGLCPYIVCKPPIKAKSKPSADQSFKEIVWSQDVKLVTVKEGSGQNREDAGVNDMLDMTDNIDDYFESRACECNYLSNNLRFVSINTVSSSQEIIVGDSVAYETIYRIVFRSRLQVK